jgi:hypothetical protein
MKWSTKETFIVCKVFKTVNWHRYADKSASVGAGSLTSLSMYLTMHLLLPYMIRSIGIRFQRPHSNYESCKDF